MNMGIARLCLRWASLLVFMAVFSIGKNQVNGAERLAGHTDTDRADLIVIDTARVFGKLERPAVPFFHDLHTEAVVKKGEGCSLCHPKNDKSQSLKFKRQKDGSKEELVDLYHTGCIGCHRDTAAVQTESGPVECGGCHRKPSPVATSWHEIDFDKSLHYRHVKAKEDRCDACHHAYDGTAKKLFYDKGKEGSCRYCHMMQAEENRASMAAVSHLSCIGCHEKTAAENKTAGPVKCSGCHDLKAQENIKKTVDVPRMKRHQPGAVLMKTPDQTGKGADPPGGRMGRVPFDHRNHEAVNASCRVCHHKDLAACGTCHTLSGTKDGGWVSFEQALHKKDSGKSCLGCHFSKTKDPDCIGCHSFLGDQVFKGSDSCTACHLNPEDPVHGSDERFEEEGAEPRLGAESRLLAARPVVAHTFSDEEIPDKVTIRSLENKYRPVEMPHRKIVHSLIGNIQDSKLVEYFHKQMKG